PEAGTLPLVGERPVELRSVAGEAGSETRGEDDPRPPPPDATSPPEAGGSVQDEPSPLGGPLLGDRPLAPATPAASPPAPSTAVPPAQRAPDELAAAPRPSGEASTGRGLMTPLSPTPPLTEPTKAPQIRAPIDGPATPPAVPTSTGPAMP